MSIAYQLFANIRNWSLLKRVLLIIAVCVFAASSFLFLTPPGENIRLFLAKTVITTQHRDWAWIFVGAQKRDVLVTEMQSITEINAEERQNLSAVNYQQGRKIENLIKVEDISGKLWKGKKMYVYDPTTIRVVVPATQGQGERITAMVERTGAVAGVNGGGFDDPEGLGNGFAPIGAIISGGNILFTDQDSSIQQHIVGFTKDGTLIIGKYSLNELLDLKVSEAVSFYPRVIANGKPLITSGDGGWGRAPRTAVGQKADGTVIFIVIDGRQTSSVGATLKEVQDLFLEDEVINAGFLDGGASSEMVVNKELITKPSSRYGERRLPSAFLVFDNPAKVEVKNIWQGLKTIDPGGSYDHPEFLKEMADKKNNASKSTAKPSTTPSITPSITPSTTPSTIPSSSPSSVPSSTPGITPKPGAVNEPTVSDKPASATPKPTMDPKTNTVPSSSPAVNGSKTEAPAAQSPVPTSSIKPSSTPAASPGGAGAAPSPTPTA
ncbi:phosphodiester glycosidase family protein [Paenibacillus sp. GP183]|uniref:phosphodiester glycosidase family protein n=1 Tax=Paenibacillus sp. GP183 TaxID=1882751 RepID=UPI0008966C40|nr:phosphodiester glycosidase family protein [Paenibacillus sp. GP183]SEC71996.1 Exopolysaccharide biosynthesis protein [Paenibacillus sp. GP183]